MGIYFPVSFGVVLEPQRPILPKLNTRRSVVLDFFFLDSWRRFCVVLRIKGRIKEPGIKKDSKGEGGWGKKKTMKKETLEISAAGFG